MQATIHTLYTSGVYRRPQSVTIEAGDPVAAQELHARAFGEPPWLAWDDRPTRLTLR